MQTRLTLTLYYLILIAFSAFKEEMCTHSGNPDYWLVCFPHIKVPHYTTSTHQDSTTNEWLWGCCSFSLIYSRMFMVFVEQGIFRDGSQRWLCDFLHFDHDDVNISNFHFQFRPNQVQICNTVDRVFDKMYWEGHNISVFMLTTRILIRT